MFFLTFMSFSSLCLFLRRSWRASFPSHSLSSSSLILWAISATSSINFWCGWSLQASTSGRRVRFLRRDWATRNGGSLAAILLLRRSKYFSCSEISYIKIGLIIIISVTKIIIKVLKIRETNFWNVFLKIF